MDAVRRQIKRRVLAPYGLEKLIPLHLQGDIPLCGAFTTGLNAVYEACLKGFLSLLRGRYEHLRGVMLDCAQGGGIVLEGALRAPSEDAEKEYDL